MLTKRVIACLDVDEGRVVKGVRFAGLRDVGEPAEMAVAYEALGADEIVLLDISATTGARRTAMKTVAAVRERLSIPLTVGGGVRTVDDAQCLLSSGADRVALNTAAVERPAILGELSRRAGAQCVVLAIDAARRSDGDRWEVLSRAATQRTGLDALDWAQRGASLGAGEILLTSWDRDGTGAGYDLELISEVARLVRIPIVASGGASSAAHMSAAVEAGAEAVLAASLFHDGVMSIADVKQELSGRGIEVRR